MAQDCVDAGRPLFVIRLKGYADPELETYPGADVGIAQLGKCIKLLKREGCRSICLAGVVKRPDFKSLRPDLRGLKALPGAIAAARTGDDGLLRFLLTEFESEGFRVEGAHEVTGGLVLREGSLGAVGPTDEHRPDIERGLHVAREIGRLDIGQGCVVVRGLVLAVEAQEGTDGMLRRCAELPATVRGTPEAPFGVLAKAPKPIQERRVDLPTIGLATVHRAAKAGLAGIVGEAGGLLVLDRAAVIEAADELGLFIYGVAREAS